MRKTNIKDETPLEFFKAIEIPYGWRFVGKSFFKTEPVYITYFYEYELQPGLFIRVDFITPTCRGGLLLIDRTKQTEEKQAVTWNKQSKDLNEFIKQWNDTRCCKP